jgi:hypothetical protein
MIPARCSVASNCSCPPLGIVCLAKPRVQQFEPRELVPSTEGLESYSGLRKELLDHTNKVRQLNDASFVRGSKRNVCDLRPHAAIATVAVAPVASLEIMSNALKLSVGVQELAWLIGKVRQSWFK